MKGSYQPSAGSFQLFMIVAVPVADSNGHYDEILY
jgi:hypothetical protein